MVSLRVRNKQQSRGPSNVVTLCCLSVLAVVGGRFLYVRHVGLKNDALYSLDNILSLSTSSLLQQSEPNSVVSSTTTAREIDTKIVVPDFKEVGRVTGTDKVRGSIAMDLCKANPNQCGIFTSGKDEFKNPQCRTKANHYYDTMYNRWLAPYAYGSPFTMLEIGFYHGSGYDAFRAFLPSDVAEIHSCEISCIKDNPKAEPRNWPWDNFASFNANYRALLDGGLLHCYDASNTKDLDKLYKEVTASGKPLKVVIDDASHLATHMAISLFYWFPKIEPGGIMVIEDIQSKEEPNNFRVRVMPQLMHDIHYCGGPEITEQVCFPTIQPLLKSIACELHICVLERNDEPVRLDESVAVPQNALQKNPDCLYM